MLCTRTLSRNILPLCVCEICLPFPPRCLSGSGWQQADRMVPYLSSRLPKATWVLRSNIQITAQF